MGTVPHNCDPHRICCRLSRSPLQERMDGENVLELRQVGDARPVERPPAAFPPLALLCSHFLLHLRLLPSPYSSLDCNRMTMAHFAVAGIDLVNNSAYADTWTHPRPLLASALANRPRPLSSRRLKESDRRNIIEWVYGLQSAGPDGLLIRTLLSTRSPSLSGTDHAVRLCPSQTEASEALRAPRSALSSLSVTTQRSMAHNVPLPHPRRVRTTARISRRRTALL